ncbi:MAG: DMT family transporter [Planctomycetia bacterium]|nr:DMT family transporter [Planctomycetia bacterium]
MRLSETAKARWCVVLAATLSSTSGFFVQSPWLGSIPESSLPIVLGFWRAFFAFLVFVPAVRRWHFHPGMLLSGLCVFGMSLAFIASMRQTTAATTIWLQCFAPFWVFLFSLLFLREKWTFRRTFPLFLAMSGVGILLGFTLRASSASGVGLLWGILAGVLFAGVIGSLRWLRQYDSTLLVAWNVGIAMLCFLPLYLATGYFPTLPQFLLLAFFGIFQFALPYRLIAKGLQKISAQEGALITLLEPILTPFWVWLFWGIAEPWWTLVGGAFVLVALVLRTVVWADEV